VSGSAHRVPWGQKAAPRGRYDIGADFRAERTRWVSAPAALSSRVIGICGLGAALASLIDLAYGAHAALALAILALGALAVGFAGMRGCRFPPSIRSGSLLTTVGVAWLAAIVFSTLVYVATRATARVDDALFESVAGFTTTALSVMDNEGLEDTAKGVLFWRALTQWFGGFGALITFVVALPFLGVGDPTEPVESRSTARSTNLLAPQARRRVKRFASVYLGLSGIGVLLFLGGGMSPFDAVTYAFTTVSTGGFANHEGSIGFFESPALEWFAIAGMLLAGANFALLWSAVRGRTHTRLLESFELRAYLGLIGAASGALLLFNASGAGFSARTVRQTVFTVVSLVSTTGHHLDDWTAWKAGGQLVLLMLMGVGAMSGSAGGGFRILRVLVLISLIRRELARQVHTHSVMVVRLGRQVIDEGVIGRMVGHMVLHTLAVAGGAIAIAAFYLGGAEPDRRLLTALSGAVSALSTTGPALEGLGPTTSVLDLPAGARAVLAALMLGGRLAFYPILAIVEAARVGSRAARRSLRRRRLRLIRR